MMVQTRPAGSGKGILYLIAIFLVSNLATFPEIASVMYRFPSAARKVASGPASGVGRGNLVKVCVARSR